MAKMKSSAQAQPVPCLWQVRITKLDAERVQFIVLNVEQPIELIASRSQFQTAAKQSDLRVHDRIDFIGEVVLNFADINGPEPYLVQAIIPK